MTLYTCSYAAYRGDMGVPVRISLQLPRWWKSPLGNEIVELTPRWRYFRLDNFAEHYLSQLDRYGVDLVRERLDEISDATRRDLVLLCHERAATRDDCHRRLFAEWWKQQTGETVPELDGPPVSGTEGDE